MKFSLILASLLLASCSRYTGTITGKVIDVSYGGAFMNSCEIVIQKGEGSSTQDQSSTIDKSVCDKADTLTGKQVIIKYQHQPFSFATETNDIIQSFELAE